MSITLELNHRSVELLIDILEERLGTLREEIYHTDTADFRDQLKSKETSLREVLAQFKGAELGIPPRSAAL